MVKRAVSQGKKQKREKKKHVKKEENTAEPAEYLQGDSDGDAPDDITFQAGKANVFSIAQDISSQIRQSKAELKEKRKKQHDENEQRKKGNKKSKKHKSKALDENDTIHDEESSVLRVRKELTAEDIEKKKRRKSELESSRLPEDFLQQIADADWGSRSDNTQEETKVPSTVVEPRKKRLPAHVEELIETGQFVPLESNTTEFRVCALDQFIRKDVSQAEQAANFRQEMLYGRRIRREPMREYLAKIKKQRAAGKHTFVTVEK